MLFYERASAHGGRGLIEGLARRCSPEGLIEAVEEGLLELSYAPEIPSLMTHDTDTPMARHRPVLPKFGDYAIEDVASEVFLAITGRKGHSRRLASRLGKRALTYEYGDGVIAASKVLLCDPVAIRHLYQVVLGERTPGFSSTHIVHVDVELLSDGDVRVRDNIDWRAVNVEYHTRVSPQHSTMSTQFVLAHQVQALAELTLAADTKADMMVDELSAKLGSYALVDSLNRLSKSSKQVAEFQELLYGEGRAIAEAVNAGRISFHEALEACRRSSRFKKWAGSIGVDSTLAREYLREATAEEWISKLPAKPLRWILFVAAGEAVDALMGGVTGKLVGLGISAVDTFVVDAVSRGWKPTQFIQGSLSRLVTGDR
jgi:hypothetical protein